MGVLLCGLLSLSMFLKFILFVAYVSTSFHFFSFCLIIFHCMDIPYFVYSFISWWKFGLTLFAYYEYCCYEHSQTNVFPFWGYIPKNRVAGSHDNLMFKFFRNSNFFPIFTSKVWGFQFLSVFASLDCTCLTIAIWVRVAWYLSHCGFDLHFPND